jgi:hypothetical protein
MPRAPSGAVDIVYEIALLPHAPFYNTGCSICWSINLHFPRAKLVTFLDTALITATVGDAPTGEVTSPNLGQTASLWRTHTSTHPLDLRDPSLRSANLSRFPQFKFRLNFPAHLPWHRGKLVEDTAVSFQYSTQYNYVNAAFWVTEIQNQLKTCIKENLILYFNI